MTQRNLTAVLLKILGVVSLIKAVDFVVYLFGMVFSMLGSFGDQSFLKILAGMLPALAPLVATLIIAFILLCCADRIAAKLFPAESPVLPDNPAPTEAWYVFGCTIIGVFLLVWYLPISILTSVSNLVWLTGDSPGSQFDPDLRRRAWTGIIQALLQAGLGLYLVFGARGIAAVLHKIRRVGLDRSCDAEIDNGDENDSIS